MGGGGGAINVTQTFLQSASRAAHIQICHIKSLMTFTMVVCFFAESAFTRWSHSEFTLSSLPFPSPPAIYICAALSAVAAAWLSDLFWNNQLYNTVQKSRTRNRCCLGSRAGNGRKQRLATFPTSFIRQTPSTAGGREGGAAEHNGWLARVGGQRCGRHRGDGLPARSRRLGIGDGNLRATARF